MKGRKKNYTITVRVDGSLGLGSGVATVEARIRRGGRAAGRVEVWVCGVGWTIIHAISTTDEERILGAIERREINVVELAGYLPTV